MLWVTLYPPGMKRHFPEGTFLDLDVPGPCKIRIAVRNRAEVGVEAPASVSILRSNVRRKDPMNDDCTNSCPES